MTVAIGFDHGGLALRGTLLEALSSTGNTVLDCGARELNQSDDYPDYAQAVGEAIRSGQATRGIIVCGSGVGASIAANKMRGIRASVCHDIYSAHQGVEHDDMNVLCIGARVVGPELAKELVRAFVTAKFSNEERFQRRVGKILNIENNHM